MLLIYLSLSVPESGAMPRTLRQFVSLLTRSLPLDPAFAVTTKKTCTVHLPNKAPQVTEKNKSLDVLVIVESAKY
jgi:hypothetical protein